MNHKTQIITLLAAALTGIAFAAGAQPLPKPTPEQLGQYEADLVAADPAPADIPAWTRDWTGEAGVGRISANHYADAVLAVTPSGDWDVYAETWRYNGWGGSQPGRLIAAAVKAWDLPRDFDGAAAWWDAAAAHIPAGRFFPMTAKNVFGADAVLSDIPAAADLDPRIIFQHAPRRGLAEADAKSWALVLRRATLWQQRSIQRGIRATGITLISADLGDLATELLAYAKDGGTDPLADVSYSADIQAAVDALPADDDLWLCLRGEFGAIYDDAYAAMRIADLEGDARAKEHEAERIARALNAKHGTIGPANAWLAAVSEETWRDHDAGLSE